MSVYQGNLNDTPNWTFSAIPTNLSGNLAGSTYTVTAISADVGYVDITASKAGQSNVTARFSVAKSKAGVVGVNGTRTASIELYKWLSAVPTGTWPTGSSIYTWATGGFTNPATLNSWTQTIGAGTAGQVLYGVRATYADSLTALTSSITWPASPVPFVVGGVGANGGAGANGYRTATLEMYQWAAVQPTTFPVGSSTYTWATGAFTAPATPNSWSLLPGAAVAGQTLWACQQIVSNQLVTATDAVTWAATSCYASGAAGTAGTNGTNGTNGTAGVNGTRTAILEMYRWSAAAPTTWPSGSSTYTWATGVFTAPATPNSWSINPGAAVVGQTLWGTRVIFSDTDTSLTDSVTWPASGQVAYAVGAAGTNGAAGNTQERVELYLFAASVPTKPTSCLYTISTATLGLQTGGTAGWSLTMPATPAHPSAVYMTTAVASTTTPATQLTLSSFTDPVVVAQNGAPGGSGNVVYAATVYRQIASTTAPTGGNFNAATAVLTAPTNWSITQPPTTTIPTHASQFIFNVVAGSTTNTGGTWSTPYIDAVAGAAGAQGPSVVVTPDRQSSFTATDGTIDGSQANIIFTAAVSGVTGPTYAWSQVGCQTAPTASTTSTYTVTSANFGTSKSAIITCTVSGAYTDKVTIVRLERSTAEANATNSASPLTNLMVESEFTSDKGSWAASWQQTAGGSHTITRNLSGPAWTPRGMNQIGCVRNGTTGAAAGSFDISDLVLYPVVAGRYYQASAYVAAHRCTTTVAIGFYTSAGAYISEHHSVGSTSSGGPEITNWGLVHVNATAPANATHMKIWQRGGPATAADPYFWGTRFMLCEVSSSSAARVPWKAYNNSTAGDLTAGTTITGGGITLDGGGMVKGGQSDFNIGAGVFLGWSTLGTPGYKFSVGDQDGHRLTYSNGVVTIKGTLDAASGTFGGSLLAGVIDFSTYGGEFHNFTVGTYTLTVPVGKTTMRVTLLGGGGGGSYALEYADCNPSYMGWTGYPGGGCGKVIVTLNDLTPGATYTLVVGAGGAGGTVSTNGGNGVTTKVTKVSNSVIVAQCVGGGGASQSVAGVAGTNGVGQSLNGGSNGGATTEDAEFYCMHVGSGYTGTVSNGNPGGNGSAMVEFYSPNTVVLQNNYQTLLAALQRQGIATV
jgi:hypothetical protein